MKRLIICVLLLLTALLGLATPAFGTADSADSAPAATLGGSVVQGDRVCSNPADALVNCGGVLNLSGTPIVAYKSWCSGAPCSDSHQWRLLRGHSTPWNEDWDAVWVPCRSYGYKDVAGLGRYPWTGGNGFHRVYDPEHLVVTTVLC